MSLDRIQLTSEYIGRPDEAYDYFLENSTWHELQQGGSAIIYILTLNRGIVSPYTTLAGTPINKILVKISIVEEDKIDKDKNYYYHGDPNYIQTIKNIQGISRVDFDNEVNNQRLAVERTLQFNNPLSPIILYSFISRQPDPRLRFLRTIYNDNLGKTNRFNILARHTQISPIMWYGSDGIH